MLTHGKTLPKGQEVLDRSGRGNRFTWRQTASILTGVVMGGLPDIHSDCGRSDSAMSKLPIVKEFWFFLRERKKWWLAPIVISLLLLGCLLIFAKSSALAPFIYSLF